MKLLIASDIHGSAFYCRKLMETYEKEGADRMVLLGDILYHGPRNDLPAEYAPKEVIRMLNEKRHEIYAVRGNCEAEVDQMVLEFPILADYCILYEHTHLLCAQEKAGILILNPGSASLPKGGNPPTYALLEDGMFSIRDFEGNTVKEIII